MEEEERGEGTGLWLIIHQKGQALLSTSLYPKYRSQICERQEYGQEPGFSPSRRAGAEAGQHSFLGADVAEYKPTFRARLEGQPLAPTSTHAQSVRYSPRA